MQQCCKFSCCCTVCDWLVCSCMTRNTWTCWSNIILVKCCVYAQKFDTLQWLTVTAEIELLVWCFVVYCVQLPVCWIFYLPWLFSLFVCHSPSESWTSSIGRVSLGLGLGHQSLGLGLGLETAESWSWSWSWRSKSWIQVWKKYVSYYMFFVK